MSGPPIAAEPTTTTTTTEQPPSDVSTEGWDKVVEIIQKYYEVSFLSDVKFVKL